MIAPRKIKFEATKKRNENYEFRIFLKKMQMIKRWMSSFTDCTKNCFPDMIAVDAEIAVRCIMARFRKKILIETQSI